MKSALLFLTSLFFSLALAEGLTRLIIDPPQPRIYPQVRYEPHPTRRFTLQANQVAYTYDKSVLIGPSGFRSNGQTALATKSILFALGDSFTFGLGVADSETWPSVLERLVPSVRVINGGTVSYGALQELDYFKERVLLLHPDIVIHGLYWNDYMGSKQLKPNDPPSLTADGHFLWDGDLTPSPARWIKDHSTLAFIISTLVIQALTPQNSGVGGYAAASNKLISGLIDSTEWEAVGAFYEEMERLAKSHHFFLAVIIMPVREIANQPRHPYPTFIRRLLDQHGIRYLDAFELWRKRGLGEEMFLPYNDHLNKEGYRVIAEAVSALIQESPSSPQLDR